METESKSFTSEEVNKIVEERLSRDRKNRQSLSELKDVLLKLKESGLIEGNSLSELAENLAKSVQPTVKEAEKSDDEISVRKFSAEIEELKRAYPELDTDALISNEDFRAFYQGMVKKNPDMTILGAYEAFIKAESIADMKQSAAMKSTPAQHSAPSGAEKLLTARQRSIAANAGMSYKEYAELLSDIPQKKMR